MKFLVLCTLLLSIAFFMGAAQAHGTKPVAVDSPIDPPHHHEVRSVHSADEPKVPSKGEAGCCG